MEPPAVFISYSHDSPEHEANVLALADRLRADGIDAVLDQYESFPSEGWELWGQRQIQAARRYGEAEPLIQRALAILEKRLGPDHPDIAHCVRNYALFLRERGRAAEAEKLEARFKASGR
jgi:hypothetical protein